MTVPANTSEQLVAALAAEGVEYVFGIPGDENLHFMEALRKDGRIKFILFRHEQAAGFAAAAYGRLTGKLAVAMSTLGMPKIGRRCLAKGALQYDGTGEHK